MSTSNARSNAPSIEKGMPQAMPRTNERTNGLTNVSGHLPENSHLGDRARDFPGGDARVDYGRLSPDDPRHGTTNGYGNLRCRCAACREAFRVKYAEYMHGDPERALRHRAREARRRLGMGMRTHAEIREQAAERERMRAEKSARYHSFDARIEVTVEGHWLWKGASQWRGKSPRRFAWESSGREIPPGQLLHRTCGMTLCINPDHFYPQERLEVLARVKRSTTPKQPHELIIGGLCRNGHPVTSDSIRRRPYDGHLTCRICDADRSRRWRQRRRNEGAA